MRIAAVVLALFVLLAVAAAFVVTQPFAGAGRPFAGPRAEPRRLEQFVRALAALGPRDDAAGQARAADWIRAELLKLGAVPLMQYYQAASHDFRNVIVTLGPQTQQRVVIGAHYDVQGPFAGADDNGSGVAALLELARMLRDAKLPLRTELVFYSNEEYGFLGSEFHARGIPAADVRAMLSLEMLGCFHEPQHFPLDVLKLLYPSRGDYIVVVGRLEDRALVRSVKRAVSGAGAKVRSIDAPESIPGIDASDHSSYWREGATAAMLTDTAWYRNPRYHTAADTPGTLDYEPMARVVDGVAAWVSDIPR